MTSQLIPTKIANPELVRRKHEQIVEAAILLFAEKGFNKTSMREIAEASGIELSYLYKYISGKDDILLLFYLHMHDRYYPVVEVVHSRPDQDPAEQLVEIIAGLFAASEGYYKQTIAAYTETRHLSERHFSIVLRKEAMYNTAFRTLIERGNKAGRFNVPDPVLTSTYVMHMVMAHMMRGWGYRRQRTVDQAREEVTRFILAALGYQGEPPVAKNKSPVTNKGESP